MPKYKTKNIINQNIMARPKKATAQFIALQKKSISERILEILQSGSSEAEKLISFSQILNEQPNKKDIQISDEGYSYLPIAIVERDLADCFLGMVQYFIDGRNIIVNEIEIQCIIKVKNPINGEWLSYCGIGTGMVEQKAKTSAENFMKYKTLEGARLACPAAYAEAIKNAAKRIGKRFGADLNRIIEEPKKKADKTTEEPLN